MIDGVPLFLRNVKEFWTTVYLIKQAMCIVKNSIKKYLINKHPALYLLYSNPFSIFLKWDNSFNLLESFLNKEKSLNASQSPKFKHSLIFKH